MKKAAMLPRLCLLFALCSALPILPAAHAGQNCEGNADTAKTQKALRLATQVRDSLELSGAAVALISRVGSDQSKRGFRYTHTGYVVKDHPAGPWTVVHELNACGTGNSDLFEEGLGNFFMDDLFAFETRIVIPSAAMQESLSRILQGPSKRSFHEATYSTIANPWVGRFQNSNGWALEVFAAAAAPAGEVVDRAGAQRWLKDNGYRPGLVTIGAGERAGARLFTPNVRFGDHPDTAWQTQRYEVNTGDSVIEFVRRFDGGSRTLTQRLDGRPEMVARPQVARVQENATPALGTPAAAPAAPTPTPRPTETAAPAPQTRGQLLQGMQSLIVPYACRPQGYLAQCRQMARGECEQQINDAVLRCFATVSDQQLLTGSEKDAMSQMQEVGYCAVESVDGAFARQGKRATTAQGKPCPTVRNYK